MPLVGPETRFQPVYVDDVAAAAAGRAGDVAPGIYELGGPETASFRDLMQRMLKLIRRRRLLVTLPFWIARIQGATLDLAQRWSFGLVKRLVTADQVRPLGRDNVVAPGARGFADLGIAADLDGGGARGLSLCATGRTASSR